MQAILLWLRFIELASRPYEDVKTSGFNPLALAKACAHDHPLLDAGALTLDRGVHS